jgi:hypothetical protein
MHCISTEQLSIIHKGNTTFYATTNTHSPIPFVCGYAINLRLLTVQERVYGSPFLPEEYNLLVTMSSSMSEKCMDWVSK